jgi:hypothetical protein
MDSMQATPVSRRYGFSDPLWYAALLAPMAAAELIRHFWWKDASPFTVRTVIMPVLLGVSLMSYARLRRATWMGSLYTALGVGIGIAACNLIERLF